MKIRPLILGLTLTAAMLAAGCDMQNTEEDVLDNTVATPDVIDDTAIDTDLDVDTNAGAVIDDGVITTQVKAALLANDTVEGLDIDVDTTQGTVRLSGMVDNQTQIDMAVQIAQGVEGVKEVQNELTVEN